MQSIIARNQGYRRQFLADDKGTVLIAVFGVPPFSRKDDGYRAVKTALQLGATLDRHGVSYSIGIATGDVFVGSVGSSDRQEHAVVGDSVNTSARLSGKAKPGVVLCDENTHDIASKDSRGTISFTPQGEIRVKGKK